MKRLAEAGGDVSATAADNVSCLHFACQKGSVGAVAELLAAKAGAQASSRARGRDSEPRSESSVAIVQAAADSA